MESNELLSGTPAPDDDAPHLLVIDDDTRIRNLLTALSETDSRIAGLEAGADDYLPKPFDPRELILRINNILRRGGPATTPKVEQIVFGPYTFQNARRELKKSGVAIKLTDREQDIL